MADHITYFNFFKGYLPQILLGSFLNTLSQTIIDKFTISNRNVTFLIENFGMEQTTQQHNGSYVRVILLISNKS